MGPQGPEGGKDVTRNRCPTAVLIALLLVWSLTLPVVAQESEEADDPGQDQAADKDKNKKKRDNDKEKRLEGVEYVEVQAPYAPTSNTIATKLPVPLQETPANVGAVNRRIIDEQRAFVLSDTLQNISGINTQTQSGVADFFVVRGYNSLDGVLVMSDGAPEPEVTYYPTYNAHAVEVLKGPAGFLYGRNPLAGAVNIIRKQPVLTNFADFTLTGGSFGTYEATVDWNAASDDGKTSFRLNAMGNGSDHYRDNKSSNQYGINPVFNWQVGAKSSLSFNLEYLRSDFSPDDGIPLQSNQIPDVSRTNDYQAPSDFSEQQLGRFQLDYQIDLSDKVTLRNKTYYRGLNWDSAGTLLEQTALDCDVPLLGEGDQVCRRQITLDDNQQFVGNQFEALVEANTGSVTHNLLVGVEVMREQDDYGLSMRGLDPLDLFDPQPEPSVDPAVPFIVGDSQVDVVAPYLLDQIKFSRKVQLLVGLRYDDIRLEVDNTLNFQDMMCPLSYTRDDSKLSPNLGLLVAPGDDLSLYASAGRAHAPLGPRVEDACLLEPEESNQIEIGAKKQFADGKIRTTFAIYRLDRERIPISDPGGVTQQAGDQQSQGFEFELGWAPSSSLHVLLSYAYNDAEFTRFTQRIRTGLPAPFDLVVLDHSGNTAPFAPKNLANVWISKRWGNGFGVGGWAALCGRAVHRAGQRFRHRQLPDHRRGPVLRPRRVAFQVELPQPRRRRIRETRQQLRHIGDPGQPVQRRR